MSQIQMDVRGLALLLTAALLPLSSLCQSAAKQPVRQNGTADSGRRATLVWSDEFNGPNGSMPDARKWDVEVNDSGYGNRELEYYTRRPVNIHQADGNLVITARKESFTGPDGQTRAYTSARIESYGHFHVRYGRIEARIKMPKGQGMWPAFWLLGNDIKSVGWPRCGEIDIVENIGAEPSTVHGSMHGPGYSGAHPLTASYTLPNQARFGDGFHVFAVEWEPKQVRFYVDDRLYETQTPENVPAGTHWVFDHPFFIILNLAVGGSWPGNPDATTVFPASMLVDYVRVYRLSKP